MNKEEIIAMARQHTIGGLEFDQDGLVAFFKAAYAAGAAAEREACAEICDRFQARDVGMQPAECAGAIRARGQS